MLHATETIRKSSDQMRLMRCWAHDYLQNVR
jgi:hypothetical protein